MKIGFLVRSNIHKWGGDLGVLYTLKTGLESLGNEAIIASSPLELHDADHLFLTNTCFDLRGDVEMLDALGKPYSIIPFHEDFSGYQPLASGFYTFIASYLGLKEVDTSLTLDHLTKYPETARYFGMIPKPFPLYNRQALASARLCIASSQTEAAVIKRDCPAAKTAVIKWTTPSPIPSVADDSFLEWTGLSSGSYLLQVGRLQARKNQLASIVATKEIDLPLVLIGIESFESAYEKTCIEAAKLRKAPTILISQKLSEMQKGAFRIVQMPEGKKLPPHLLWSAFYHAGLYLHPAFQELPGLVFLEAAAFGLPMVASTFCTIDEYLHGDNILFPPPHDLSAIQKCILHLFGKRFPPIPPRHSLDVAQDFISTIS
jgi:glycosyltransferase involved in cell wall biosynthesis